MSLALVTLSGHFRGFDDQPVVEGTVTFTPSEWKLEPATDFTYAPEPVTSGLAADGSLSVPLLAPTSFDDGDMIYRVDIAIGGGRTAIKDSYTITMPVCDPGSFLDLADRDPVSGLMVVSIAPVPVPNLDEGVWL